VLNRRRFLKYAGATAAVVGVSVLGLDLALPRNPASVDQSASTLPHFGQSGSHASSAVTTSNTTDLQMQLFHDYHGDGRQQADEPPITDLAFEVRGVDNDYSGMIQVESDGEYWARDIPLGGTYRVSPRTDQFRYVALSNIECMRISDYAFTVTSREANLRLGLMEGLLTLCYPNGTKYIVGRSYMEGRYYDRDPSALTYLWWNGEAGTETLTGLHANSGHTDIGADYGTPVVASAPGTVSYLGEDIVGGGLIVEINHGVDDLSTNYIHLSKQLVSLGQRVARGETMGLSGPGQPREQGNVFQHTAFGAFYYEKTGVAFVDPYKSQRFMGNPGCWFSAYGAYGQNWILSSTSDLRNLVDYWTKSNQPQYPVA
jgi:hypothetical protein